jgi:hypothetical protein
MRMQLPSLFTFAFQATSVAAAVIANSRTTLLNALNRMTWQGMYNESSLTTLPAALRLAEDLINLDEEGTKDTLIILN